MGRALPRWITLSGLAVAGCAPASTPSGTPSTEASASDPAGSAVASAPEEVEVEVPISDLPIANDASQHDVLRSIAASYTQFYRADGMWWSPYDCLAPPAAPPRISAAPVDTPHGRKLYTLQIADFAAYAKETASSAEPHAGHVRAPPQDVIMSKIPGASQAVVKVSYAPSTAPPKQPVLGVGSVTDHGTTYYPGEQRDLFVMYRPTREGADTDAGWLYGTVTPDAQTVTSAGKVASCMRCHAKATHGRLFGVR